MTQHINPGTDTTINPVVIDDSYRERKQQQTKKNIADEKFQIELTGYEIQQVLKAVGTATSLWAKNRRQCPASVNTDVLMAACDKIAHSVDTHTDTPAHPPEAQQRVDEAIAYCNQRHFEVEDDDGTIYEVIPKGEIIALLQAGRK